MPVYMMLEFGRDETHFVNLPPQTTFPPLDLITEILFNNLVNVRRL